jgi:hypothetical protein
MNVVSAAEGPLKTVVFLLVVFAAVVVLGTYSEPFAAEYEVKTAAKIACNTMVRDPNRQDPSRNIWEKPFLLKARTAGVTLTPEQYAFDLTMNRNENVCKAAIAWRSSTEFILVGFLFEMPPMKIVHRLDINHTVKAKY